MARRQSRPTRPAARPAARASSATPVRQTAQPPAVQQQRQPGMFAQMASTAAGVAVGSTIGHMAGNGLSALFGGSSSPQTVEQPQVADQPVNTATSCDVDQKAFMKCLDTNHNDISACQFYLDMYKQCQSDSQFR